MNNTIRNILRKGKDKNSPKNEEEEMYDLFLQPDKEFEVKSELLADLAAEQSSGYDEFLKHKSFYLGIWEKIEKRQRQQRWRSFNLVNIFKLSAVLVVGVLIGSLVHSNKSQDLKPVYYEARSPRGSVSEVILPDNSVIFLNADSKVRYSVDGEKGIREVFLDGEAWFEVAKNRQKPFVVHTPFYDVNVTGTKFNVKTYEADETLETTLEEGQVIIKPTANTSATADITIKPGEQAVLDKESKEIVVRKVNTQWFTSWKDNKLVFVNMNLKDLVVLLERKYGVEIEIKNTDLLALHFDGTIKNESIIEFMEIIRKTLPVKYKINGQKVEITDKN